MSNILNLGLSVRDFNDSPEFSSYTKVVIVVTDKLEYSAGTTEGRTLTLSCPWGTQAMADRLLEQLRGFKYQPYTASGAIMDPAAELGDGVLVANTFSGLYKMDTAFGHLYTADIAAPADEEIEHEYPYVSATTRRVERRLNSLSAELNIQADQITAKVSQTGGDAKSFGWALQLESWEVYANSKTVLSVNKSGASITGYVKATSGDIGGCQIINGVLRVPAANITGTLTAAQVDATNLKVQAANIEGTLTATQIDATNLQVDGANITGTLTAATISVDKLTAGSNSAEITFNGLFTATQATIEGKITAKSGKIGSWNLGVNGLLQNVYDGAALYTDPYYEDGVELVTSLTPEGLYIHYRYELQADVYYVSWMEMVRVINNSK